MQASDIPGLVKIKWARDASGTYLRAIPDTSVDPNAASWTLGWPPNVQTPVSAGGSPPDGRDENGALQAISAWIQWVNAGGAPGMLYNSAFSTSVGGYPMGAFLANKNTLGQYWISTADNNTTDPDGGSPLNWMAFPPSQTITRNGQCYFKFVTTTLLALVPQDGNGLVINGSLRAIPAAGVSISNAGLAASTFYYCYAHWTGSAIALELSATGHVTGTDGTEVKTGDVTRALVGCCITQGDTTFADNQNYIGVLSWFNKRPKYAWNAPAGNTPVGVSVSPVEMNVNNQTHFLNWQGLGIVVSYWAVFQSTVGGSRTTLFMGVDGIGGLDVVAGGQYSQIVCPNAAQNQSVASGFPYSPGGFDGTHYVTIGVEVFENLTTFSGNGGYGTSVQVQG